MVYHLGYFFSQLGEVAEVSAVKGKNSIATGDVDIFVTVDRKNFSDIPNILICGGQPIYVVVEGR